MPVRTPKARRILARTPPEIFVGRGEQAREITSLAAPKAGQQSLLILAAPQSGVSELLRQSFDELFRQRGGASPVYFAFSRAEAAALGPTPFVLAGLRRRAADILNSAGYQVGPDSLRRLHLDRLKEADARVLVEGLARTQSVAVNDETRDLLVQQLESSPYLITAIF